MTHSRLSLAELHQVLLVTVATSGMRHELRNKLSSLRNASFFLKRKFDGQQVWKDDGRVPRFFQIMEAELAAAEEIVASGLSDILQEPAMTRFDPAEAVRAAIGMAPAPDGVALSVAPGSFRVSANAAELTVAIRCLLDNAIDSVMAAGGGSVVVGFSTSPPAHVAIEVVDDGPGFSQSDPTPWLLPFATTKPGRLGLGLNVAKRVATRAGGSLEVMAAPPRGARASIEIAAAQVEGDNVEPAHPVGR